MPSAQYGEKVHEDLNRYRTSEPLRILRSYRTLASCYRCGSIDIQVLSDLAFILCILLILAILLQTTKTRTAHMKVLSDLSIVLPLRFYRHSGPIGPGVHPANPAHPGHPASDTEKARRGTAHPRTTLKAKETFPFDTQSNVWYP